MVVVEKLKDGKFYLCTQKGKYKKMAKLKERPRNMFFVKNELAFRFVNGKRKIYNYGAIQVSNMKIRVPDKLIGVHIRFLCQYKNDVGEWEDAG